MAVEPKRIISVNESDFNVMTHIAKMNGFVYPEGHTSAGKMISSKVVEYLIKNFQEPIA